MNRDYLLVSPVRDEAEFARRTLESVTRQTLLPARWIIVDDGSTDGTSEILADYAQRYPFIEIHRREDRGERSVGPGVIEALYAGLDRVPDLRRYAYLCKLDLDLDLPPDYFRRLVEKMEAEPRLGTCSGKPFTAGPGNAGKTLDGELVREACGDEMSVGMTKFYRTRCFIEIGGFQRAVMWDGIDCHECRRRGWLARSDDEPGLRFLHLRPMGSSHRGIFTGRRRHGAGQYYMGTGLLYMAVSAFYRMFERPYVLGGAAMLQGYLQSMLARAPRYGDAQFRGFLRRYQRAALWLGKRRATRQLDERQAGTWRPSAE